MIINHLAEHGVIDAALLYESPFVDIAPHGPEGIFSAPLVDDLVAILQGIQATAMAA